MNRVGVKPWWLRKMMRGVTPTVIHGGEHLGDVKLLCVKVLAEEKGPLTQKGEATAMALKANVWGTSILS